jgi:hypothetical protein
MARPFMFAALCYRAHPLKHSLAESIFVSRVRKTAKNSSLAEKSLAGSLVSRGITVLAFSVFFIIIRQIKMTNINYAKARKLKL